MPKQVLTPTQAATIDQLLQGVVQGGTGTAAALPGREVAGKTGTTENYGDAWFVGFTPQLVAAVWVGYPDKLIPMTYQFHGHAVAGGTFPALIWKAFMTKALAYMKAPPENFAAPPSLSHRRSGSSTATACSSATTACARTRTRWSSTAAKARRAPPAASRTRSRSRTWSARASRRPETRLDGQPLTARGHLQAGEDRRPHRLRRRPVPAPRHGIGLRQDHARPREVTARRGPARRRAAARSAPSGSSRGCTSRCATKAARAAAIVHQSLPAHTASAPGPDDRAHARSRKAAG